MSITDLNLDQVFNGVNAGMEIGKNLANSLCDTIDPDSRRGVPGSNYFYQQNPNGGYYPPQQPQYGYGYGDPGGMFQQSIVSYPGISNPGYGKGGGMR